MECGLVLLQCDMANMQLLIQGLLEKGKAFSTIKVYLAAISACCIGFHKKMVGAQP